MRRPGVEMTPSRSPEVRGRRGREFVRGPTEARAQGVRGSGRDVDMLQDAGRYLAGHHRRQFDKRLSRLQAEDLLTVARISASVLSMQ